MLSARIRAPPPVGIELLEESDDLLLLREHKLPSEQAVAQKTGTNMEPY